MLAYLVLVHRYPDQFDRLFRAIYHPANFYWIHVDRKSEPGIHDSVRRSLHGYPNVSIAAGRKVVWGGYSMVEATLDGVRDALKSGDSWQWLINLSGQDFPLRSQTAIMEFLSASACKGYMLFGEQRRDRPDTVPRIEYFHLELGNRVLRLPIKRRFPSDVIPYIGSQWFILSRTVCEFIINSGTLNRFESLFRHTLIPDESFFQTMVLNSDYSTSIVNDNRRLIVWAPISKVKKRPRVLTYDDLPLMSSSTDFFARKFDQTVDSSLLDYLEAVLQRTGANLSRQAPPSQCPFRNAATGARSCACE
jgi:hypothetical protein